MTGRLILLTTTARVAPGLLTSDAWDALRTADRVLTASEDHPQLEPIRAAGIAVEVAEMPAEALARWLLDRAVDASLVWLTDPEGELALSSALAAGLVRGAAVELELLPGSYDLPGAHLLDLVEVMDRLRSPGGCPWDAEQTHASLLPYLLEESYEVIEAVENADAEHLREELGDLLLQVAFHARIASERSVEDGGFSIDDVADGIATKLVRRHPHVFGGHENPTSADGAAWVATRWEEIKVIEKARTSVLDGIPASLPALAYATKVAARAQRLGLVPANDPAAATGDEATGDEAAGNDEALGAKLLDLVVAASANGLDAEGALRRAVKSWTRALRDHEAASA